MNARFRCLFREGYELWVVYNENFNSARDPVEANSPMSLTFLRRQ
jgi:hypothetical protein